MTGLEPLLVIFARRLYKWANSSSPTNNGFPSLDFEGQTLSDQDGILVKLSCSATLPDDTLVAFHILSQGGALIKAEEGFRDDDGDFYLTSRTVNNGCLLYLPYAAIRHPSAGTYMLRITAVKLRGDNEAPIPVGRCELDLKLPAPRPWRKINYIRPVLDLCMFLVRAEGKASAQKVRFVKDALRDQFTLHKDEVDQMREAMKVESPYAIEALVKEIRIRFVDMDVADLLSFLAGIAKSDRTVTAPEVELVRRVALACDCAPDEWPERAKSLGLNSFDHWSVLGLSPGASLQQITAAFRRLIHQHHPDRFSTASEEVRQRASYRTVAITEAYKVLRAQHSASA